MNTLVFPTIVLSTRNLGKLREFRSLLLPLESELLSLKDLCLDVEIDESGSTFAENARLKAIGYSRLTRFPVLADDSGLEVAALGGWPGVHSARYAGPEASDSDRVQKLLGELEKVDGERTARFVCALALAREGVLLLESKGECRGVIAKEPRGYNGFGYDPIFLFPELGKTLAELSETEKNRRSHRAHASASLLRQIANPQSKSFNRSSGGPE